RRAARGQALGAGGPARAARTRGFLRPHAQEAAVGRPLRPRAPVVLTELRVRDLAVIADVTLSLTPGLNVLTGETGAGKALLVDLHGQHETQSLLKSDAQRDMLDLYAAAAVERAAVRDAHARLRELEQREEALLAQRDDVQRKADYLRHVVEEISRAGPRVGETESLDMEAKRLEHADELGRLARELEQALETVNTAGLARAAKLFAS